MGYAVKRPRIINKLMRVPVLKHRIKRWSDSWLTRKYELDWGYFKNPASRRRFRDELPTLSSAQQRVLGTLKTRGIASIDFLELFDDPQLWNRLSRYVDGFVGDAEYLLTYFRRSGLPGGNPVVHPRNIEKVRRYLASKEQARGDDYLIKFLPEMAAISLDDEFMRLALDGKILDVVNSYLGLWAKLIYVDLWQTVRASDAEARIGSQHWHRDPEDKMMVKVYLYFSKVDAAAGAMQYLPGSCLGGPYEHLWKSSKPTGYTYPRPQEIEQQLSASQWISCTGGPGTFVFCDTSGLHRGGISTTGVRTLATWTFVTPASLWPRRFCLEEEPTKRRLSRAARYAVA